LEVAGRLAGAPGDPTRAWAGHARGLPGPFVYWLCTAVVVGAATAVAAAGWRLWRRTTKPTRVRFGVPTDARIAGRRDVAPLVVSSSTPPTGRLLLGRQAGHGPLLATEDRERHPARTRAGRRRQGSRGSVAVIGPTQSGKTTLLTAGILGWNGPVVALSVKRDLYDATAVARRRKGEVAVFDPSGVTGLPSARWTPLRNVTTASGAMRAGRALAQAIPRSGVAGGGDYWASHGEDLLGAFMAIAGLSRLLPAPGKAGQEPITIARLASWSYMEVGATDPLCNDLLTRGLDRTMPLEVQLLAVQAATKLISLHREDHKIRSSIYATARLAGQAWLEPAVAHSATADPRLTYASDEVWPRRPRYIDLDWLMEGDDDHANTLYLAAPDEEFERLAPVLGGLLSDLKGQIHDADIAGDRLAKPLLIVIDEAAQLELKWLPAEVSTLAGLGAILITSWQSKAQISHRYGTLADAVLGGHRSKVFFSGVDDPATLDYLARVLGTEHVARRGWSADTRGGRRSVFEQPQREELAPAHVIRQMAPGEAVLLHGTLPPIHLRTVYWRTDPTLRNLVPVDPHGHPRAPAEPLTCPLTAVDAADPGPLVDPAVLVESRDHLPKPSPAGKPPATSTDPGPRSPRPSGEPTDERPVANRSTAWCERCRRRLPPGTGQVRRRGGRDVILCRPACPSDPPDTYQLTLAGTDGNAPEPSGRP
jgi:type IV secretion system protein VirD4